jgi:hypothetical protein
VALQRCFVSQVAALSGAARIGQILEMIQKKISPVAPNASEAGPIASSANESEDHDRFGTSAIDHELLRPITLHADTRLL